MIDELSKSVEEKGFVIDLNSSFEIFDFDGILKHMDVNGKYTENVIYCSPLLFDKFKEMLDVRGYKGENVSYGVFERANYSAMHYLVDLAFHRGSYEFYLIKKDMEGGIVCPAYARDSRESFLRNSTRIHFNN
jgi:hypothetical protein